MPKMIGLGSSDTAFTSVEEMGTGRESPKHQRDMGWGGMGHSSSQHSQPECPGCSPLLLALAQEMHYSLLLSCVAFMHHYNMAGFRLLLSHGAGRPNSTANTVSTTQPRCSLPAAGKRQRHGCGRGSGSQAMTVALSPAEAPAQQLDL